MRVKSMETLMQGLQLIANIRYDKQYRNQAYILVNVEGQVNCITSTCISILKLDIKLINSKEKKIDHFFPGLMDEKESYMSKQGGIFQYKFPLGGTFKDLDPPRSVDLKITITEICFSNDEFVGYIIKIDKVADSNISRLRP